VIVEEEPRINMKSMKRLKLMKRGRV